MHSYIWMSCFCWNFSKQLPLKVLKHICCAKHGGNLRCYHPSAIIILSPAVLEEQNMGFLGCFEAKPDALI